MADIFFVSDAKKKISGKSREINVRQLQEHLGHQTCKQILVVHALGGCDTVSGLYGIGKGKILKKITSCESTLLQTADIENMSADADTILKAGMTLMVMLYGGKSTDTLNKLRYSAYCKMVFCITV